MTHVRAISIDSDVYCMDYGAMKLSKNGKFVLRNYSFRIDKNEKSSDKFELSGQFV